MKLLQSKIVKNYEDIRNIPGKFPEFNFSVNVTILYSHSPLGLLSIRMDDHYYVFFDLSAFLKCSFFNQLCHTVLLSVLICCI